jgi:outer membrane protein assembly factor BamB
MYSHHGNFNPYTTAPETAHVIWTRPIAPGGQVGGELGPEDTELYYTGTAYEAKFGAIIINGILYYTEVPGAGTTRGELKAVNMRTGEEIWSSPMRSQYHTLYTSMVYNFKTGDQYGGIPYLFTSNTAQLGFYQNIYEPPVWSMYNAMDGKWILDISNVSAGTRTRGPNGELLSYTSSGGMLKLFNMSRRIQENSWDQIFSIYTPIEIWRPPYNVTIDWNLGYEWSVPMAGPGSINTVVDGVIQTGFDQGGAFGVPGGAQTGWRVDSGYDADTGALLWGPINRTLTPFTALVTRGWGGEGIYTEYNRNTLTYTAYSLETGQKMWTAEPEDSPWGYYDYAKGIVIGYGKAYSFGLGGGVYAYDVETGERLWKFDPGEAGLDTPYGIWPLGTWGDHHILADGKLYVRGGHDYTPPVWKGGKIYCIDVETGEEIWSSLSIDIVGSPAIADGTLIWVNGYDNQIYAYDKGPSKTTVSAPEAGISQGTSLVISGKITDESPGTKSTLLTSRFPNGVPAVSDASQSAYMEYLYQMQPMPTDAVGVEVTIDVIDSNGNFRNIGTATSDASGFYSLEWMPDIPGKYTVIATFAGSDAYFASYDETAFVVDKAPEATPAPDPTPAPMTDTYVLGMGAAAIIVIIIFGLLILLMLRKR